MTDPAPSDPAAPRASRCWTLICPDGSIDVELVVRDADPVSAVVDALTRALGVPGEALWAGSTRLAGDRTLAAPELGHGAVLGLGRPVPPGARGGRSSALELHVVGGPDAGRTVPLGQGRHVLGRGAEATIRLDDPDVSRQHALVQVGGGSITVADLASTNGSRLAAHELDDRPRPWPAGEILRMGTTALTITGPVATPAAVDGRAAGRLRLRPMRTVSTPRADVEIPFPRTPAAPPHRRLAWVTVALPAVGGILMALVLHTPTFLFFALLGPVVAVGTWLSDRTSGRRAGRRDAAAHAVELAAAQNRLAAAVRADVRAAEVAAPDLAAISTAARRRGRLLWSRGREAADALVVRIGTAPGSTAVVRVQGDGSRLRETAAHLPVVADLRSGGGLGVVGPRERTLGVVRAVLAQVTALHPPGDVELLFLLDADRLHDWTWARWLPHLASGGVHVGVIPAGFGSDKDDDALNAWLTTVVRRRRTLAAGRPQEVAPACWLVVVADRPLDPRIVATLRGARDAGVLTLSTAESAATLPVPAGSVVRLAGETGDVATLSTQGGPDHAGIAVDRLPRSTAADLARDLAGLTPVSSASSLPSSVRLLDLPGDGLHLDSVGGVGGAWSTDRDHLVATLGRTAEGPIRIDLCRQGPHALIAGTTGSGKSELLQTLIAGLALNHPPDRCSFLLVDYKGGAAFAEAAALPHTVGLVTDLDGQTTARALRSLAAELTRREAILGEHRVSDIAALPPTVELARLVIVVDEFATLVDELPSFIPGLVSIAQRGRSLGVHLVLATQRPSGVVSPEIRANCTLRICLRTTDEADSRDVLGTPDAAFLPVEVPGRAFLRAGSGEPAAVQVARVATSGPGRAPDGPEARRWTWPPSSPAVTGPPAPRDGDSDLARLTRAIARHAAEAAVRLPHRPWRPPLPDLLPATTETSGHEPGICGARSLLRIGLVDRPDTQSQHPLELDLAEGGAWLVVGGPRSGRSTVLRTVLGEAVRRLGPDELHVHVLESGGGALAADASALPHAGTTIGGDDALRTVRLIDRLAREIADRRAGTHEGAQPLILLLIDGVESIAALLDETDPGRGSSNLHRLLRDGAAVGVTCVLTADRAVPGGRLASVARQRLVLPFPDRADYAVAGVSARDVPAHRPPGRALLGEDAAECQVALPRQLPARTAPPERGAATALRIVELPPDPHLPLPGPVPEGDASTGCLRLPLGPGGDEGRVLTVDLLRTGGLLVAGPPGSGRSAALDAFARHLLATGVPVLRIGRAAGGHAETGSPLVDPAWAEPGDPGAVSDWLEHLGGSPAVVIADDVGAPADAPAVGRLPAPGPASGVALVAAASAGQLSAHFQGAVAALRRGRSGVLLCPAPGDADLLSVRLPRTPLPVRPGSGWLVIGGSPERVQLARRRSPGRADPR
ncbi:MAG: FtsK/SpoIIIE domain-containing protein [Blastococcus sp.]